MNGSGFQRLSLNANYLKTLCISKLKCCTHHISRILDTRFAVPIILRSVALAVFAVSTSYNLGETFRRTFSLGSTYVSMYGWAVHFITFDTVEKLRVFDFTVSEEPSWKASSQAFDEHHLDILFSSGTRAKKLLDHFQGSHHVARKSNTQSPSLASWYTAQLLRLSLAVLELWFVVAGMCLCTVGGA